MELVPSPSRPPETMVRKLLSPKKRAPDALADEAGVGDAGGLASRAAVCFRVR